jgi:uncharacterized membrane protein
MADEQKPVVDAAVGSPEDVEKGKGMAWLAYLGILFLVPMLSLKDNAFAKFHVKQGIMLLIFYVAISIIFAIPILGWIVGTVGYVFGLVMCIMGIVNSLQGKYWKMPLLGNWAASWFKF